MSTGPTGSAAVSPTGMVAGMADGSVRFLSKDIDPHVMEQLAMVHGDKNVDMGVVEPQPPEGLCETAGGCPGEAAVRRRAAGRRLRAAASAVRSQGAGDARHADRQDRASQYAAGRCGASRIGDRQPACQLRPRRHGGTGRIAPRSDLDRGPRHDGRQGAGSDCRAAKHDAGRRERTGPVDQHGRPSPEPAADPLPAFPT